MTMTVAAVVVLVETLTIETTMATATMMTWKKMSKSENTKRITVVIY